MSTFLEGLFSQFPLTNNFPENTTADLDVTHTAFRLLMVTC